MNYGPYIAAAIDRIPLDNAEVARRVGVTADAVRKWRRGEGVKLANLEKLANALGCPVGDLLPNSGAGAASDQFEPIAAALIGLEPMEVREQILILASQARMNASSILRRLRVVDHETISEQGTYNSQPTQKGAGLIFGERSGNAPAESDDDGASETRSAGGDNHKPEYERRTVRPGVQEVRQNSSGTPELPKRRKRGAK